MSKDLSAVLIGFSLLAAVWTMVLAALNRPVGNRLLIELTVVEVLVAVQSILAVVKVIVVGRPDSTVTFLAYAFGALLIVPVGVFWSTAEKSRSSTLVITVAGLALAVMTVRMLQMWSTVHG